MFPPASRYAKADDVRSPACRTASVVTALVLPGPRSPAPIGYHPRAVGDRLDLLAAEYLNDPTGFWRLCDANNSLVAGALEHRALIGVPGAAS